jgi:hypothetical protein
MSRRAVSLKQLLFIFFAASTVALAAGPITVTIPSTAGPWSQALNPSFNYGIPNNSPPVIINSSSGVSFAPGATITVTYVSGTVAISPNSVFTDANGYSGLVTNFPYSGPDGVFPGYFMGPAPLVYIGELVGTFANNGVIVGKPFPIGDGPTQLTVPSGATQLLLGVNDVYFTDNIGAWTVKVEAPVQLVDPISDLLNGPAVVRPGDTTAGGDFGTDLLATKGRIVQGVSADGVSQTVLRISAANPGDQYTLTLMNDRGNPSQSPSEDGALGSPGDTAFSQNQVTVTAVATTSNDSFAFAVYQAPKDFFRSAADDSAASRQVSIQIQPLSGGAAASAKITILRPLVMLIHGIWSGPTATWGNFTPLITDNRFTIAKAKYDFDASGLITASTPTYTPAILQHAQTNSFGFAYNAHFVLLQLRVALDVFRNGGNQGAIPVAAVQADIIAHSLGGPIARASVLQSGYLSDTTFGQGPIHKIITIDSPHLGTPLATAGLDNRNACVRNQLAKRGNVVFQSITTPFGTFNGAAFDLAGDGLGNGFLSNDMMDIQLPGPHTLPTAFVAGITSLSNVASLDTNSLAKLILHDKCGILQNNPLGKALTSTAWDTVFGQKNDGIVPLSSEADNLGLFPLPGFVHSPGTEDLGFTGPSVLDDTGTTPNVPPQVINLLNTAVTDPAFHALNP